MNTNELNYFITLAEEKSATKASAQLYISYQGLTKAIKGLEKELGYPLFYKDGNHYELTEYGHELYVSAKKVLKEWDSLKINLDQIYRRNKKEFHIGVAMGIEQSIPNFRRKVLTLLAEHKNIVMMDAWDSYCEEKVGAMDIDLALTYGPVDVERFDSIVLSKGHLAALVHQTHPYFKKETLSIGDLRNQRIITVNRFFKNYEIFQSACAMHGFEPNIILNTVGLDDTLKNNNDKSIIGITNTIVYQNSRNLGEYRLIPIPDQNFHFELCCIINKQLPNYCEMIELRNDLMKIILSKDETNFD